MTERVDTPGIEPADFRVHVVAQAIRLFSENGYEATTVEQIASAEIGRASCRERV